MSASPQRARRPLPEDEPARGFLSLAELARRIGVSEPKTRRLLAHFLATGVAECDGDHWRLTSAGLDTYGPLAAIRDGNVPLEDGDDDGLSHCRPGPSPAAGRGELRISEPNRHPRRMVPSGREGAGASGEALAPDHAGGAEDV